MVRQPANAHSVQQQPNPDTQLLNRLATGEVGAQEEILERVQLELKRLAARHMAQQRPGHTLQPTALVNEAWLRMFGSQELHFEGRRQFYRFASRVMRSVLVDHERAVQAEKRGGGHERISLSGLNSDQGSQAGVDVLDLDGALTELEGVDPELAQVVELRFFGGLSHPDISEISGRSLRTIERQWRIARAWLFDRLGSGA